MEHRINSDDDESIRTTTTRGGLGLKDLAHRILQFLAPDQIDVARVERSETREPAPQAHDRKAQRHNIVQDAVKPLHDPKLREPLAEIQKKNEVTIVTSAPTKSSKAASLRTH
jgi:type I restriction enzyme R subunit